MSLLKLNHRIKKYCQAGKLAGLVFLSQVSLNTFAQDSIAAENATGIGHPIFWASVAIICILTILSTIYIVYRKAEQNTLSDAECPATDNEEALELTNTSVMLNDEDIINSQLAQQHSTTTGLFQVKRHYELLHQAVNSTSDGIFIANDNYHIIYVNNAYLAFTGEEHRQVINSPLQFKQYPKQFEENVKSSLVQANHWAGELDTLVASGRTSTINLRIDAITDDNQNQHFVGVFSDITEQKNTEKELLKLANVDSLTQLPNRTYFHSYQEYLIQTSTPHTLLCLDLDNFKKINDTVGHTAGDQLLQQMVKRLENLLRKNMILFRLGGDEFAVIVESKAEIHRVSHFAQSVLDQLALPYQIYGQEFVVKASIGIAFYPTDGGSPQEILKNADTAMYFAKNLGGNGYQFYQEQLNQEALKQLNTENLIRYGLQHDLFRVFYQPKVDVKTGQLCGMEALVRFEHPEQGLISPAEFIPMAEETGQILDIGEKVLEIACSDTARWVANGLLQGKVAINIAALQFKQADFALQVRRIMEEAGLSAKHLECEITECTLIDNPEEALNVMQALRTQGVQLALDDFGTGYSSLAYLKSFPINTLKIDKAFIDDIDKNHTDKNMVQAIINIAHNLGLKVVAEGVEKESQLEVLSDFGCEMSQGYLFSRPLNAQKFEQLLAANLTMPQQASVH